MRSVMKTGFLFLLLAAMLSSCASASPRDSVESIDTHLTELAEAEEFSGAVLIARDGELLLNKGYGFADFEAQTPITPQTRFPLTNVTMPFTAMAVLMLQADGLLDVQDPICDYLPDCPEYWQEISIHHLLTHTSGLHDRIQPWEADSRPSTSLEIVETFKHNPPYFAPGESLRYSGNAYLLLGYLIEDLSGQSYEAFLDERIFTPLGMHSTGLDCSDAAVGYRSVGDPVLPHDPLFLFSAYGLCSTVEDLYLWDQALYTETLLPREDLETMFTGYALTPSIDFEGAQYGYGWFVGDTLGRPLLFHGGMTFGHGAMILRFPEERLTVIVLRNFGVEIYDRLEIDLAEMVFEGG